MHLEQKIYQIKVAGALQDKWARWLNGAVIQILQETNSTTLLIVVPDQAALRGIMNKLWDLNLTILSMLESDGQTNRGGSNE